MDLHGMAGGKKSAICLPHIVKKKNTIKVQTVKVNDVFFGAPQVFLIQTFLTEMKEELHSLLGMFHKVKQVGGAANLAISTKSSINFANELDPGASTSTHASTSSPSPPAPGNQATGRRRLLLLPQHGWILLSSSCSPTTTLFSSLLE